MWDSFLGVCVGGGGGSVFCIWFQFCDIVLFRFDNHISTCNCTLGGPFRKGLDKQIISVKL